MTAFLPQALTVEGLLSLVLPVAELHPHYLCVCTNINWIAARQPEQYKRCVVAHRAPGPGLGSARARCHVAPWGRERPCPSEDCTGQADYTAHTLHAPW